MGVLMNKRHVRGDCRLAARCGLPGVDRSGHWVAVALEELEVTPLYGNEKVCATTSDVWARRPPHSELYRGSGPASSLLPWGERLNGVASAALRFQWPPVRSPGWENLMVI
ncbi:unnamed protein product [Gadus morhua 'NCC']